MKLNKPLITQQAEGFLSSYAQIFFSDNRWFAAILLVVSFIDAQAGIAGAIAVLAANLTARSMGFSNWFVRKGYYGYNSLLVGLGFGLTFQPGLAFYFLLLIAALLTFLFTVAIQGVFYKYGLPFLSIPFLLGIWLVMASSGEFTALGLSSRGVYVHNELFAIGGKWLIDSVEWFDRLIKSTFIRTYLFSLGAIFFQYNLLAGVLIASGILLFSRIAFTLSIYGFFLAWLFYTLTGADINVLGYSYIGFNYILTSIAIGGFFLIPSRWSYLWLLWLLPMVILVTLSLQKLFSIFQLGLYALPFNLVVITFLYVLKIRLNPGHRLIETPVQQFSPEKNLYHLRTNAGRFSSPDYLPVGLPVLGEWTINQAYNGELTHRGEWRHALDLIMVGNTGKQFRGEGILAREYYCYEKPVVAPADGIIADLTDGIPDNAIGETNLRQNWGNSIIIRHSDHLFSQVSHLKPGSIKVKKGDTVKKGDAIALCGNSGRSPYPHLHFQLQTTPHIGSRTIHYPLSNYLVERNGQQLLETHAVPLLNDTVTAIRNHPLFEQVFHFLPGKKLAFEVTDSGKSWLDGRHEWEVKTDEYNNSYIECTRTGATAWFYNNGNIHYFINFLGTRKSLLYFYYLGFYKVLTGFYGGLSVTDHLPPDKVFNPVQLFWQDFLAPFSIYLKSAYTIEYIALNEDFYASSAKLLSTITLGRRRKLVITSALADGCISGFEVVSDHLTFKAICTESL
jgi:urea transporter/murein DD-endopeptidase MepM/ murein hydrolase activator NlpD